MAVGLWGAGRGFVGWIRKAERSRKTKRGVLGWLAHGEKKREK